MTRAEAIKNTAYCLAFYGILSFCLSLCHSVSVSVSGLFLCVCVCVCVCACKSERERERERRERKNVSTHVLGMDAC
jgi:hypothetical protein